MIKKIISYLELNHIGVVEVLFAATPLLSGFGLKGLPLSVLMWVILIVLSFIVPPRLSFSFVRFPAFTLFVLYWVIHTLFILLLSEVNINSCIAQLLFFLSVFVVTPIIDFRRLKGSLNWIAIITLIGLLFQLPEVFSGGVVHPISIPGLDMPESRLENSIIRPSSFFMEPAAYVGFMVFPLFLSLLDRKFIWSSILILSIFLTGSTTGIVVVFIILIVYTMTQNVELKNKVLVIILGLALLYAFTTLGIFNVGLEKLGETNVETNVRLSQGRYIVSTMLPNELLFGAPFSDAYHYCISGRATDVYYYGESVFMPTLWSIILLYGIFGLVLYSIVHYSLFRQSRQTLPCLGYLFATWFSGGVGIGWQFAFSLIILLCITKNYPNRKRVYYHEDYSY